MLAFVDTNVLVYCTDAGAPAKRERARALVSRLSAAGEAVVSTQVLIELFHTLTRKQKMAPAAAQALTQAFTAWPVIDSDLTLVNAAIEKSITHQLSIWDAMVVKQLGPQFARTALDTVIEWHKTSMRKFGIAFDTFYRESTLMESGYFMETIEELRRRGHIEERDGAVWLKSKELGEDIDSVLIRSTGVPTYFGVDVAYHRDALVERRLDKKIDVWGANTHGHARRMKTAMAALGLEGRWEVVLYQFVKFLHEGVLVNMARRRGQYVLLEDVIDTVGVDAARWFFLIVSADRTLDFDLELAAQESNDNPVYYVQYAHARIASIFRTAAERDLRSDGADVALLADAAELDLVRLMLRFPELVEEVREKHNVHLFTGYGLELAGAFHAFYKGNRVVGEDPARSKARLRLVEAVGLTLRQTLGLLGVSAPASM